MKKIFVLFLFLFFIGDTWASTIVSRFAEQEYASENSLEKVHIVVKKEHTLDYWQKSERDTVQAIAFGYGDLKIKRFKKIRITYICLLDKDYKPFRSYIIPIK